MTHSRKVAVRKRLRRRRALFREYGQELVEFVEAELRTKVIEEENRVILFGQGQCLPTSDCGCIGHTWPGVEHMVPCCDKPHISVEEYAQAICDGIENGGS